MSGGDRGARAPLHLGAPAVHRRPVRGDRVNNRRAAGRGRGRAHRRRHDHSQPAPTKASRSRSIRGSTARAVACWRLSHDDVLVGPGWMRRARALLAADPAIGVVGPASNECAGAQRMRMVSYDGAGDAAAFSELWAAEHQGELAIVPRLAGMCLVMRREVMMRVGGFDTLFGWGKGADEDFSVRAARAGWKLAIALDVFVHHQGGATYRRLRARPAPGGRRGLARVLRQVGPRGVGEHRRRLRAPRRGDVRARARSRAAALHGTSSVPRRRPRRWPAGNRSASCASPTTWTIRRGGRRANVGVARRGPSFRRDLHGARPGGADRPHRAAHRGRAGAGAGARSPRRSPARASRSPICPRCCSRRPRCRPRAGIRSTPPRASSCAPGANAIGSARARRPPAGLRSWTRRNAGRAAARATAISGLPQPELARRIRSSRSARRASAAASRRS